MQRQAVFFGAREKIKEAEFDRLFNDSYQLIVRAAYRLIGDRDEAEDLTVEAFWKLWQNPPHSQANLLGWLYRTVINLCYNRMRSARRRTKYEESAYRLVENQSSQNPAEMNEIRQISAEVRNVLQSLPERDVQILILHSIGLTYHEISAALAIKESSIGTLLARSEKKFADHYTRRRDHASNR
jgi:RNA polymerase sigma factor (sigma-70 family)